jgi:methionine aminopeptidase
MGIKNKTLRTGDLVEIKAGTHWDGSDISRVGFILGPGQYHKSYMILFTETGKEEQIHGSFIRLISTAYGEKIRFVQKI